MATTLTPRQLFLQHLAQTSDSPLLLEVERAEGVYMYRPDGRPILDLISGIGVSNVGHRHPRVMEAIARQSEKYLHLMVYGEVVQSPQNQLAATLAKTLPASLDNFYFLNSGSEAIEAALKLAKRATGRREIVTCLNAYHGSSHGALSAGGNEYFKQAYRPLLPGFRQVAFGSEQALEAITCRTAAFLVETVQGEAGIRTAPSGWFQAVKKRCEETGTLLILDEIQAGAGRTGTLWAFEQEGIVPDVLVAAKGMGGGMPVGALITRRELMQVFSAQPVLGHITTFGGHPLSCVAAEATFQVLQEEGLLASIPAKSAIFRQRLAESPWVSEVRGRGLMLAAELPDYPFLKAVIDRLLEKGLLTDWFLFCDRAMRIAPPLIISEEQCHQACDLILAEIEAVGQTKKSGGNP